MRNEVFNNTCFVNRKKFAISWKLKKKTKEYKRRNH